MCDISGYQPVKDNERIYFGGLSLNAATILFATATVYNTVGLSAMMSSEGVVVSPDPNLTVIDGNGEDDIDFQSDLNVIQGRSNLFYSFSFLISTHFVKLWESHVFYCLSLELVLFSEF